MKIIKPVDDQSRLDLVYIDKETNTPYCKEHGAMNMLTPNGLWRCFSEYYVIDHRTDYIKERSCDASCYWEESK